MIASNEDQGVIDKILNHLHAKGTLPSPPDLLPKASWKARKAVEECGFNWKPGELGRLKSG